MKKIKVQVDGKIFYLDLKKLKSGNFINFEYSPDEEQPEYDLTQPALQENWRVWGQYWLQFGAIHVRIMGSHTDKERWIAYYIGNVPDGYGLNQEAIDMASWYVVPEAKRI